MIKAKEQFDGLRSLLDDVMYRTDDLSDEEYNKIRSAYNDLCAIHDRLFWYITFIKYHGRMYGYSGVSGTIAVLVEKSDW